MYSLVTVFVNVGLGDLQLVTTSAVTPGLVFIVRQGCGCQYSASKYKMCDLLGQNQGAWSPEYSQHRRHYTS